MQRSLKRKPPARESGQTLILFTLFIIVLVLFVGLGLDLGFAYITRAQLSKAVDAACLTGLRNYNSDPVKEQHAKDLAASTFRANYGISGRDVVSPVVLNPASVTFSIVNNNITLDINARTEINTFFIRVLPALLSAGPSWKTLKVGSLAQATRPNLILGLVVDTSGSMANNGGGAALPGAVANFIDMFDDQLDRASMSSFAYHAELNVAMKHEFKQDIKDATDALNYIGWTASEQGLTNAWAQVRTNATLAAGEKVVKVVVFMTDGLANTWRYTFNCGQRNIAQGPDLYNPDTGALANDGCTIPPTIPRIDGQGNVNTGNNCDILIEGQKRAEHIANLIRAENIYVYSIGLGDPTARDECGFPPLNIPFLKRVSNTTDSTTFDPLQPIGEVAIAATAGELNRAFNEIANKILARLTK